MATRFGRRTEEGLTVCKEVLPIGGSLGKDDRGHNAGATGHQEDVGLLEAGVGRGQTRHKDVGFKPEGVQRMQVQGVKKSDGTPLYLTSQADCLQNISIGSPPSWLCHEKVPMIILVKLAKLIWDNIQVSK